MRIAIICNNIVSNIIVADSIEIASTATGIDVSNMLVIDNLQCQIGQPVESVVLVADSIISDNQALPDILVSPVEFMLLFTSPERIYIKSIRQSDPVVSDFMDIIEHPKLTIVNLALASTQQAVDYLLSKFVDAGTITEALVADRREAILSGKFQ